MSTGAQVAAFIERLAWLATHEVDIWQFLGEEHYEDAKRFAEKRTARAKPTRPQKSRRTRTVRYTGPGFSKAS